MYMYSLVVYRTASTINIELQMTLIGAKGFVLAIYTLTTFLCVCVCVQVQPGEP